MDPRQKEQEEQDEQEAGQGRTVLDGLEKLEVFGRSLLPGWLTVGLQPCLLNMT